jgi:hypothetical protein
MGLILFTERHQEQIAGVISCYDRMLIQGTLPGLCYAQGMTRYLYARQIRIFDYPRFAQPLRDALRQNAERLAAANGLEIEFIRRTKSFRKEDKVHEVLKQRGDHPGLVWIFSAMEPCSTYQPWHDKTSGKTYLRPDDGKCLHYYFYFIDPELGLCSVRVPTWCPFRLQVYLNGHHRLARRLTQKGIGHTRLDNAFTRIEDFDCAQALADHWPVEKLHRKLDEWAERYCPVILPLEVGYHWSLDQVEFATDIVFRRQSDLQAIYGHLTRTAIHAVKPDHVATFLGRKLTAGYQDEMGNRFDTRIAGTRIRHTMGPATIKMYDKFGLILRIETTVNEVSFFPHYRTVEQRDGSTVTKWASMKKSIYSLPALREALLAANRRYLEFISTLDDPSAGVDRLDKVSQPVRENDRTYRGFNFFAAEDQHLFETLARGEFNLRGVQNRTLRPHLAHRTSAQVSRLLKRLRLHGLLKRIGRTYRYYLTQFGKHALTAGLKLKQLVLIPELAYTHAT